MPHNPVSAAFAPQLIIRDGAAAIEFYKAAFGAVLQNRWNNEDGSVHVAELSLQGAVFHIREESEEKAHLGPAKAGCITVIVGIFVPNVDAVVITALAAGAALLSPARDYDYHYRQASLTDPFGHYWLIEQRI
jgi:PhnB protein